MIEAFIDRQRELDPDEFLDEYGISTDMLVDKFIDLVIEKYAKEEEAEYDDDY